MGSLGPPMSCTACPWELTAWGGKKDPHTAVSPDILMEILHYSQVYNIGIEITWIVGRGSRYRIQKASSNKKRSLVAMVQPGRAGWPWDMQASPQARPPPPTCSLLDHLQHTEEKGVGKKPFQWNDRELIAGKLWLFPAGRFPLFSFLHRRLPVTTTARPVSCTRAANELGLCLRPSVLHTWLSATGRRQAASPEIPARLWSQQQQSHAPKPGRREADWGAHTGSTCLCKESCLL